MAASTEEGLTDATVRVTDSLRSAQCVAGARQEVASGQVPSQRCSFNSEARAGPVDRQMTGGGRPSFCYESVEVARLRKSRRF